MISRATNARHFGTTMIRSCALAACMGCVCAGSVLAQVSEGADEELPPFLAATRMLDAAERNITVYDLDFNVLGTIGEPDVYSGPDGSAPAFSPDRARVAAIRSDPDTETSDLLILDVETGEATRLTSSEPGERVMTPVWSPDGRELAFVIQRGDRYHIYRRPMDGEVEGDGESVYSIEGEVLLGDWSHNGRYLAFTGRGPEDRGAGLYLIDLESGGGPVMVAEADSIDATLQSPHFSPDDRYLSYLSFRAMSPGLYVTRAAPAPADGHETWRLTDTPTLNPGFWDFDDPVFYYISEGRLRAIDVDTRGDFELDNRRIVATMPDELIRGPFSISRDGERLLIAALPAENLPEAVDVQPSLLSLEVGETASLAATVSNAAGDEIDVPVIFMSSDRRSLDVDRNGSVEALAPGDFTVRVLLPRQGNGPLTAEIPVSVAWPPVERVEIDGIPNPLWAGSLVEAPVRVVDATGAVRTNVEVSFETDDPEVLRVDRFGMLRAVRPGYTTFRVTAGGVTSEVDLRVVPDTISSFKIEPSSVDARTGDVIRFAAVAHDAAGRTLENVPVHFSVQALPNAGDPAAPAAAQVASDGRFVAERPGRYTVVAAGPNRAATATVEVSPRGVERTLEVLGRGPVRDRHTSDLWVWEGADGRDYAVTGTWRSDGSAYFWDVTDPGDIRMIDTVQVDARTVNDVKVAKNGRLAVISLEGASNRRNGIVLLDISDPADVVEITSYSEELTGGVHNLFIEGEHVFAVNNSRRFDVINIAKPKWPVHVGGFELTAPGHSIHDVWVEDGIAYSSNWRDGVVLVDVGNGMAGGRPDMPMQIASYADPSGRTHAAFPFRSESTGRFYIVTGDERFLPSLDPEGPTVTGGYMHIIDFTDLENPVEVARYEVPEAGSHNMWIENDVLYAAYYTGGLRIVDLSGELMGDLYRQGREIARFVPKDEDGYVGNESMVWGAQPHKGTIFISDWNSGLWALGFEEE